MFKPYQNKSSLKRKYSRYLQGGVSTVSGDKIGYWEKADIAKGAPDDQPFEVTNLEMYRPDLVAKMFYGTTELEWLVLQYNDIVDIQEEFGVGAKLMLPSRSRVSSITNKAALTR